MAGKPGRKVEGWHAWVLVLVEFALRIREDLQDWPRPYKPRRVIEWLLPAAAALLNKREEDLRKLRWAEFRQLLESLPEALRLSTTARWLDGIVRPNNIDIVEDILQKLGAAGKENLARKYVSIFRELGFDRAWAFALQVIVQKRLNGTPNFELICGGLPPGFDRVVEFVTRLYHNGQMDCLCIQCSSALTFPEFYALITDCPEADGGRIWTPPPGLNVNDAKQQFPKAQIRLSRDFPETIRVLDDWLGQIINQQLNQMNRTVYSLVWDENFWDNTLDYTQAIREQVIDRLREELTKKRR